MHELKMKRGPIVPPDSFCPLPSPWSLAVTTQTQTSSKPEVTGGQQGFICAKQTQIIPRKKNMIYKTLSTTGDGDQEELKLEIPARAGL